VLKDGRVLVTLRDAADVFMSFSRDRQAREWSSYAIKLLIRGAEDGSAGAIEKATRQVQRALFREGMI
jgi:hypothetical protein